MDDFAAGYGHPVLLSPNNNGPLNMNGFLLREFAGDIGAAVAELLADRSCKLYKAGEIEPSATVTRVDLSNAQCDFSGYAGQATVATAPTAQVLPDGGYQLTGALRTFTATVPMEGEFVMNQVGGYWIEVGTEAVCVVPFPAPVNITQPGDFVQLLELIRSDLPA